MEKPSIEEITGLVALLRDSGVCTEEDIFNLEVVCHQTDWENWGNDAQMSKVQPGYERAYTNGMIVLFSLFRFIHS